MYIPNAGVTKVEYYNASIELPLKLKAILRLFKKKKSLKTRIKIEY